MTTHTYARLDIDPHAYSDVRAAIIRAGLEVRIHGDDGRGERIDMTGLALAPRPDHPDGGGPADEVRGEPSSR